MKFEQLETLNEYLTQEGKEYKVEQKIVIKPEEILKGYEIIYTDKDKNMYPTIYTCPEIEEMSIQEFTDYIDEIVLNSPKNLIINDFLTREYIEEHVLPRFVNSSHKDNLNANNTFYTVWNDLLIIYYVPVDITTEGNSTFTLNNNIIKHVGMLDFDFYSKAIKNLESQVVFENMATVLATMLGNEDILEQTDFPPMYVATTPNKIYGAPVILTTSFAEKVKMHIGEDAVIIPSSIHEVIIVPAKDTETMAITHMIQEVNECEVKANEILSNHPYIMNKGIISMPE